VCASAILLLSNLVGVALYLGSVVSFSAAFIGRSNYGAAHPRHETREPQVALLPGPPIIYESLTGFPADQLPAGLTAK